MTFEPQHAPTTSRPRTDPEPGVAQHTDLPISMATVLQLQRTAGNQAVVSRLIQRDGPGAITPHTETRPISAADALTSAGADVRRQERSMATVYRWFDMAAGGQLVRLWAQGYKSSADLLAEMRCRISVPPEVTAHSLPDIIRWWARQRGITLPRGTQRSEASPAASSGLETALGVVGEGVNVPGLSTPAREHGRPVGAHGGLNVGLSGVRQEIRTGRIRLSATYGWDRSMTIGGAVRIRHGSLDTVANVEGSLSPGDGGHGVQWSVTLSLPNEFIPHAQEMDRVFREVEQHIHDLVTRQGGSVGEAVNAVGEASDVMQHTAGVGQPERDEGSAATNRRQPSVGMQVRGDTQTGQTSFLLNLTVVM